MPFIIGLQNNVWANRSDSSPPQYISGSVNAVGTTLTLTFSETVVNYTGFTFRADAAIKTLSNPSVSGNTITFTTQYVGNGQVCTLDYVPGNVQDSNGNALPAFYGTTVINGSATTSFRDDFIGPIVEDLQDHIPATFEDFEAPTQTARWVEVNGTGGKIGIRSNRPTYTAAPNFWAALTVPSVTACYLVNYSAPQNFRLSCRVYNQTGQNFEITCCADFDLAKAAIVRFQGTAVKLLDVTTKSVNTTTPLQETASSWVATNRWHWVEIEVNGGTLSLYVDQVLAFTHDVSSSHTGRYFGIRQYGTNTNSITDYMEVTEYVAINRVYVDMSHVGGVNDGSFSDPYNVQGDYVSYVNNNGQAGDRICFKTGVDHLDSGTIDFYACTDMSFYPYGPAETDVVAPEHAQFHRLDTRTWTPSGVNGEYYTAQTSAPITVLEDVGTTGVYARMDGNCLQNTTSNRWAEALAETRSDGTSPVIPVAGALGEGQWAWNDLNNRIYMKPTGTYASNAYLVSTAGASLVEWWAPVRVTVYGLWGWGSPGGGQLKQLNGGNNLLFWNCIASHGKKGLLLGEGTSNATYPQTQHQYGKVYKCESYYVDWKGVSTEGPASNKGFHDGLWVLNYNHDIGEHESVCADVEGLMLTPLCNHNKIFLNSSCDIGTMMTWNTYSSGMVHPCGFISDGAANCRFAYNYVYNTRSGFHLSASEFQDAPGIVCHDNLIIDCGIASPAYGTSRRNDAFSMRAAKRASEPAGTTHDGEYTIRWNTITSCQFGDDAYNQAILTSVIDTALCVIDADFSYNVIDDDDASQRIMSHQQTNIAHELNFSSDYNVFGMSGAALTNGVRNNLPTGAVDISFANMNIGGTGWLYQDDTSDPGNYCDANSTTSAPQLDNTTFKPLLSSSAKDLGDDTAHPTGLDFYLNPRVGNFAGAIDGSIVMVSATVLASGDLVVVELSSPSTSGAGSITAGWTIKADGTTVTINDGNWSSADGQTFYGPNDSIRYITLELDWSIQMGESVTVAYTETDIVGLATFADTAATNNSETLFGAYYDRLSIGGDVTFVSTTSRTYLDTNGDIQTVTANNPRYETWSGHTYLLMEPDGTRLNDADPDNWTTPYGGTAVAADGTGTIANLPSVEITGMTVAWHRVVALSTAMTGIHTLSFFMETGDFLAIDVTRTNGGTRVQADITGGSDPSVTSLPGTTGTYAFISKEEVSTGVWLYILTFTPITDAENYTVDVSGNWSPVTTGRFSGLQVEVGNVATSYIPGTGASVARDGELPSGLVYSVAGLESTVTTVTYIDDAGVEQTTTTTHYSYDSGLDELTVGKSGEINRIVSVVSAGESSSDPVYQQYYPSVLANTEWLTGNPGRGMEMACKINWNGTNYQASYETDNAAVSDGAYVRFPWRVIQPNNSTSYNFDLLDTIINTNFSNGKQTGISLMPWRPVLDYFDGQPANYEQALPQWFYDQIVASGDYIMVDTNVGNAGGDDITNILMPDWDATPYITAMQNLIAAFKSKYDNVDWAYKISYLDWRVLGAWGENHHLAPEGTGTKYQGTQNVVPWCLWTTQETLIDSFENWTYIPILANMYNNWLKTVNDINNYGGHPMVEFGNISTLQDGPIGWRNDGPEVTAYITDPPLDNYVNTGNLWKHGPIAMEPAGSNGFQMVYDPGGPSEIAIANVLTRMENWKTSTANNKWTTYTGTLKTTMDPFFKKCGYRLYVDEATVPLSVGINIPFNVSIKMNNNGIAPFYRFNLYQLRVRFTPTSGSAVTYDLTPASGDIRQVLPSTQTTFSKTGAMLAAGTYTTEVGLIQTVGSGAPVQLSHASGINTQDSDGWWTEINVLTVL